MTGGRRARAICRFGAAAAVVMVAGQMLCGLLVWTDLAGTGWRLVFLINVPVERAGVAGGVLTGGRRLTADD
ncbi:hypothetical protein [Streptomyces mayteni]